MTSFSSLEQILQKKLKSIPGITFDTSSGALSQNVRLLKDIPVSNTDSCNVDPKT